MIKNVKTQLLFLMLACFSLTSCLEIFDETSIKEDGSGSVTSSLDMSQMIAMMSAMGGEEFEKMKNDKIDTSINLKDFVDTAQNLTSEQKRLLRNGTAKVKMDVGDKEFRIDIKTPFSNIKDLQSLSNLSGQSIFTLTNLMDDVMGSKKGNDTGKDPELGDILGIFDYTVKDGTISKAINQAKLKKLLDNPQMADMKQASEMGMEINYKTVYKLPRAVKSVDNKKVKLSDDKKTATLKLNLLDIFTEPEQFAFNINY
jgi:hypothetical protein